MATSIWKGHLTFGLVSIPLRIYAAARSEGIHFHQLHRECNTRIRQPLFCPSCKRIVERSEVVKGYEYEKGRYVLVEEAELKKVAPESANTMEITEFVSLDEVDPLYFDTSYLTVPEDAGRKAYKLLLAALEDSRRVAMARLTMHQREYVVVVRPRDKGLTLHTMLFVNEIRKVSEYGQTEGIKVKPEELKLAKQLIESLSVEFEPEKYHDDYQEHLRKLVDAKLKGKEVAAAPAPKLAPVIDMMEALKKSLKTTQAARAARPERAAPAPRKVHRRAS